MRAVAAIILVVACSAAAPGPSDDVKLDIPRAHLYVRDPDESTMLADINALRLAAGMHAVTMDAKLRRIAREYAREMLALGFFGHRDPAGKTLVDRLRDARYGFRTAGENIAFAPDEPTAQGNFSKSTGHRHNMLNAAFTRVGIGAIADSAYGTVFVQEFAGD